MGLFGSSTPWTMNTYKAHQKSRKIIDKSENPRLLVEIADKADDYGYNLSIYALKRLHVVLQSNHFDNETLRYIALARVNPNYHSSASGISSPGVELKNAHECVIETVINQIEDDQILKEIALSQEDAFADIALCKITDQHILCEIQNKTKSEHIQKTAALFAEFRADGGLSFGKKLGKTQNSELYETFKESPILFPFALDINTVMAKNHFKWSENGHSYFGGNPGDFMRSAERLIALAKAQPKHIAPIWDKLAKQINEATDSREIFVRGGYEMADSYDDGPRLSAKMNLKSSKHSMGLQFPELPIEFRT